MIASGSIGLGTSTPQAKLQVEANILLNGNTTIADGSQKAGAIWVSDANGTGTWKDLNISKGLQARHQIYSDINIYGETSFPLTETHIRAFSGSGGGGGGEASSIPNSFFTAWSDNAVPQSERVPVDSNIKTHALYMIVSGEYLFWFDGIGIQGGRYPNYTPYSGNIYGILRIRTGNTIGLDEGILFEKEFIGQTMSESFYTKIEVPAPYTWTPVYITFQRYAPNPSLDWVSYPSGGTQIISSGFSLVKLDAWN